MIPVADSKSGFQGLLALSLIVLTGAGGILFGPVGAAAIVGGIGAAVIGLFVFRYTKNAEPRSIARPSTETTVTSDPLVTTSSEADLRQILVLALIVRFATVIVVNTTPLWLNFAPDAIYYRMSGEAISDSWHGAFVDFSIWFGRTGIPLYPTLNAIAIEITGQPRFTMSFINSLVSLVAVWNFATFAGQIYGAQVRRLTFILGAFFPSILLWSCMNIREAWSFLLLSLILVSGQRLRTRVTPSDLFILLASIGAMYFIRWYLVPLLFVAVAASYFFVSVRQLPIALLGLVAVGGFAAIFRDQLGLTSEFIWEDSLERVSYMRDNLAIGGSAYAAGVDTSTIGGTIRYLPIGFVYFLMSPFPWEVRSWMQALTIPEILVWYGLLYLAIRELIYQVRTRATKVALPLSLMLTITAAYGLVSGNGGTAYRHRAQVALFFLVFSAAALVRRRYPPRGPNRPAHRARVPS